MCYVGTDSENTVLYFTCAFQTISLSVLSAKRSWILRIAMALQGEAGEQPQSGWFTRYSRERRDLSASVEDALAVSSEQQWDEEDEEEVGSWKRSKHKGSLIPPRLSLQSKQMPTIHSGGFVEAAAEMQREVSTSDKTVQAPADTQRESLWARVARRVTTSLAALGATTYPEAFPVTPVALSGEPQFLSWQQDVSLLPPPISQDEVYTSNAQFASPPVSSFDALAGGFSASPPSTGIGEQATSSIGSMTSGARRQRSASHMTKIRLRIPTPMPAEPSEQQTIDTPMPENMWIRDQSPYPSSRGSTTSPGDRPGVDLPAQAFDSTSGHLPAIAVSGQGGAPRRRKNSAPLSIVKETQQSARQVGLLAFFGGGTIESGQCDIPVADAHTTSTSVVHVMLTSNPGPVVVQYISLQPLSGFTIHLTAPAALSATFNYVILRIEP
jgi:hypothetical protein